MSKVVTKPTALRREEYEKIGGNHRAAKFLEELQTNSTEGMTDLYQLVEEAIITAGTAQATGNDALAMLERIARAIEAISAAPVPQVDLSALEARLTALECARIPAVDLTTVTARLDALEARPPSHADNHIDFMLGVTKESQEAAFDDTPNKGLVYIGVTAPDLVQINGGGWGYTFANTAAAASEDILLLNAQAPHGVTGFEYRVHIHAVLGSAPTGTDNVRWETQVITFDAAGDLSEAARLTTTTVDMPIDGAWAANSYHIVGVINLTIPTLTASSIVQVQIRRKSSDAADTYESDFYVLDFDGHAQYNRFGTYEEY